MFMRLTSETFLLSSTSAELSPTTGERGLVENGPITPLMTTATITRKPEYLS